MTDIEEALERLAIKRPLFHSEADFQHALAWKIHQQLPDHSIRLELKPPHINDRFYIDLWVANKENAIAIELKYKTRGLSLEHEDERFDLLNQSAQDCGRYDFCKDIERLEVVVSKKPNMIGYAIFLTNDSAYWKETKKDQPADSDFRIHEGRKLSGNLEWGSQASEGTKRGRNNPISIKGTYDLTWKNFSETNLKSPYGKFRYLLVIIGNLKNIPQSFNHRSPSQKKF